MSSQRTTDGAADWPLRPLPAIAAALGADLAVRPWSPDDAVQLADGWADPLVQRWLSPPAGGVAAASAWIGGCEERRQRGLALDLALVNGSDDVVGEVGLSSFDARRRACRIGWWLGVGYRGRGLAAQAVGAVAPMCMDALGALALVAECDRANHPSRRTARRAGFTRVGIHDDKLVYVLRADPGCPGAPPSPPAPC